MENPTVEENQHVEAERWKREYGYTDALATEILREMASGKLLSDLHESTDRRIAGETMYPEPSIIRLWAVENINGFASKFERAEHMCAHSLFEKAMSYAGLGDETRSVLDLGRDKLIIDTVKWATEKLYPKKFGPKVDASNMVIPVHIKTTLDMQAAVQSLEPYSVKVETDEDSNNVH